MLSQCGLMSTITSNSQKSGKRIMPKAKKTKKKKQPMPSCIGVAMQLEPRGISPNPFTPSCSAKCKHPSSRTSESTTQDFSQAVDKLSTEGWIPDDMYKRFTETDSRPTSPGNFSRRSSSAPGSVKVPIRKRRCITPEPEARQCHIYNRKTLILDLRKVKSYENIVTRPNSQTGTSIDSTFGDEPMSHTKNTSPKRDLPIGVRRSASRSASPAVRPAQNLRAKFAKARSISTNIPLDRPKSTKYTEKSLPPLHSSVLTLLGMGSSLSKGDEDFGLPIGSRQKLRRHGRKTGKSKREDEFSEDKRSESRGKSLFGSRSVTEKDDYTEINRYGSAENADEQLEADESSSEESSVEPLCDVIDAHNYGGVWQPKEMSTLSQDIEQLSEELQKLDTKFKSNNFKMKEDQLLLFPRTWSRSSAVFGCPSNPALLSRMHPTEYLRKYVYPSESRKLFYDLVFHRYRMMENPTGNNITIMVVQRALVEIVGQTFTDEQMETLKAKYLGIKNCNYTVDQELFRGIAALCERLYTPYSLEQSSDCHSCVNDKFKNKESCHEEQGNPLEQADVEYILTKIKTGKVNPHLAAIYSAIAEKMALIKHNKN